MEEVLIKKLIVSLVIALEETSEETKRIVKSKVKDVLSLYLVSKKKEYEEAKKYEEQCLQSDDGFSRETEEAMANTEDLSFQVRHAEELLEMFPPDKVIRIMTMSGEHFITEA